MKKEEKELRFNTSAENLYRISERLGDPDDVLWGNLRKGGSDERAQLIALFHVGAAVVRAFDDLTISVKIAERSIDKMGTELARLVENKA